MVNNGGFEVFLGDTLTCSFARLAVNEHYQIKERLV
jgi:hypothetical protein